MICCDICWIVLGKSNEVEDMLDDKRLWFIGKWEVCQNCLVRIENDILKDIKAKRYKKN